MGNTKQTTSTILMIRPRHFGFNTETAENNTFQTTDLSDNADEMKSKALKEFDHMVDQLRNARIHVIVIEDSDDPNKPDAIFPNNWITTHEDGSLITYPMFSRIRRNERREEIIEYLESDIPFSKRYAFEHYEEENLFLEGTGSMVLDRVNRIVYACLSPRTSIELLDKFAVLKGYQVVRFKAQSDGIDIYHTNVMMAMGNDFVVICMDAIPEEEDKELVLSTFRKTDKEVIEISLAQMNAFAGNMLEVENIDGDHIMVMSEQAFNALNNTQISRISNHTQILAVPIQTIEKYGGGSARCMIAEIFLPGN